MEETREWRLKQRLCRLCDKMFSPKRAQRAKNEILYWLLRHPALYIAGDTLEFYLVNECGEKLPQADFMSYIRYALSEDLDSIDEDLEAIRIEVDRIKRQHFENAAATAAVLQ